MKKIKTRGRETSISIKNLNGESTFQSHPDDGLAVSSSNSKRNTHTKSTSDRGKRSSYTKKT